MTCLKALLHLILASIVFLISLHLGGKIKYFYDMEDVYLLLCVMFISQHEVSDVLVRYMCMLTLADCVV